MQFNKGGPGKQRGFGFGGFAMASKPKETRKIPVSPAAAVLSGRAQGTRGLSSGSQSGHRHDDRFPLPGQRRPVFMDSDDEEDEWKYDDGENEVNYKPDQPYDPSDAATADNDDDDEDELDKFMAGIESQVKKQENLSEAQRAEKEKKKVVRDDIEAEDDLESYFNYIKNAPVASFDDEEELEYDSDGNPIVPEKSKIIEPLPRVDHFEIDYPDFEKNFYSEHEGILQLSEREIEDLRNKLAIKVSGAQPPRPCISFAHFGFDEQLMGSIRKLEYTQPTPIQCQAVPVALSGRDVIGIAKTGSGKTAAFLWPALVHIMDQAELEQGDGPIALICAPTRELCQQIYVEARRFGKVYNIKACAVFGGGNKYEQTKALQGCPEIVVATPGRLIDHVKSKATNLQRVTYLVFDEADRMFDMGFEPQVRSIANNVRPDRQTLLFSATFKKRIEKLCREILVDPIRVVIGELGEANQDIAQTVKIFTAGPEKWSWLLDHLVSFTSTGSVLIFVTKKLNSEELAANLKKNDFDVVLLHGDMDQFERNKVINAFKKKEIPIMVATDVAARGLDIPSIKTVVNYDVARDIHTHTHRIGRTGRAGEKGEAYTLMTSADQNFAGDLVRNLEGANQSVPEKLMELAMKSSWFRKTRFRGGRGKQRDRGGGDKPRVRERPGLGMADKEGEHDTQYQSPPAATSSSRPGSLYASFRPASSPSTGGGTPSSGVFSRDARSDRQAALKQAFQAQYKSHFKAASSATTWDAMGAHSTAKPAAAPKPKKSRWDTGT